MTDFTSLPVTGSELDSSDHPVHGYRRPAGLADVFAGLRAQVRGELPESRPVCPVVVTESLPRHTREDALRQETELHRQCLGSRGRAHWAEQLAEAEFGWHSSYELSRQVEGHTVVSSFDFVADGGETLHDVTADPRWTAQLAEAEFLQWLRLEAGLTDREVEALQQRAAGTAQSDRSGATLARAQRRAQAALA